MAIRGFGAVLQACLSLLVLMVVCFMFVDDDQMQQTAIHPNQPAEEVVPPSQEALDYWVGFLGSTGGAINPEKSYWHMLDWEWENGTWKPRTLPHMPGELTATDPNGLKSHCNGWNPQRLLCNWESFRLQTAAKRPSSNISSPKPMLLLQTSDAKDF